MVTCHLGQSLPLKKGLHHRETSSGMDEVREKRWLVSGRRDLEEGKEVELSEKAAWKM